jgi:MarR family transcriptional repressor of emrRAB
MVAEQIKLVEASLKRLSTRFADLPANEVLIIRLLLFLAHDISMMLERHIRPHGLGEGEFRALTILFSQPDGAAHPGDLCPRASQSPANMSRISDGLVSRGLITREPSAQDRRKLVMRITPKGEDLVRSVLPTLFAPMRDVCGQHSPQQQRLLITQLKQMAKRLDEVTGPGLAEPAG